MSYKLDNTSLSSEYGSFQVYDTWQSSIVISGSIPNLYYNQYQTVITFNKDIARGRVYIQRPDTGLKAPFNVAVKLATLLPTYTIYQYAGSETVQTSTSYNAAGSLFVNMYILNRTGGTLTLIPQTLNILTELYIAPVS